MTAGNSRIGGLIIARDSDSGRFFELHPLIMKTDLYTKIVITIGAAFLVMAELRPMTVANA